MTPEQAAALLGVHTNDVNPFDVTDPFNDGNRLEGHICRRSDHRYGALVIHGVRGQAVQPQAILCTPKVPYPFGRTDSAGIDLRQYHFPPKVAKVEVYEKLDGTNVCAYGYADSRGNRYLTFKTRLTAILGDSRFGAFGAMWRELLADEPLQRLAEKAMYGECTLSFEMYGYRNPHLLVYDVPLAARLLFAVRQADGAVLPPHQVARDHPCILKPMAVLTSPEDLIGFYNEKRAQAESLNRKLLDGDEERVEGTEGYVFYVLDAAGQWHPFKCKPESVEALHWTSETIPLSVILPTTWNALESCEGELTDDYVRQLLIEEFSESQVNASQRRIEKAVEQVRSRIAWRVIVQQRYEATGLSMQTHGKQAVMRALSQVFNRSEMKKVFTALKEMGIIPVSRPSSDGPGTRPADECCGPGSS